MPAPIVPNDTKSARLVRLALLLAESRPTPAEASRALGVDVRSVYRYLAELDALGLPVEREGRRLRLARERSALIAGLAEGLTFSEAEARTLMGALSAVGDNSPEVRRLLAKLAPRHDFGVLAVHAADSRAAENFARLYRAVTERRTVILRRYASHSSKGCSDRVVEPYFFRSGNTEVVCYELASGLNKTFKISRAERVDVTDLSWSFRERHVLPSPDVFGFTGMPRSTVRLRLGRLSLSLLLQEYPAAEAFVGAAAADGRRVFEAPVCDLRGPARFVLGLMDDLCVEGDAEFRGYLRKRLAEASSALGGPESVS